MFNLNSQFSYSDLFDKILILIGTIGALASAISFPVVFLFYGQIANSFVSYQSSLIIQSTANRNLKKLFFI